MPSAEAKGAKKVRAETRQVVHEKLFPYSYLYNIYEIYKLSIM